ncbi:MAG: GGDEF domain-containing response regulator [Hyphomicrobium sp.]|nr:GGDEF domain-containing response regulator [Hyphomicrobium sp.]
MGVPTHLSDRAECGQTKILLIEDSASDAQLIRLLLRSEFAVTTASRLSRGLTHLRREQFDLVLIDLSLPDADAIDAIGQVQRTLASVPIVALSSVDDEQLALRALREGAQDWLVKAQMDRSLLLRVIRYAQERHRLLAALQSLALTDTLTGLYNRRGFITVAEEQLKLARRSGYSLALAFVDLDGMKRINDELGHEFGDQALVATAQILRSTFRASDVIARLGGDEFIVLAIAAGPAVSNRIRRQLLQSLAEHNRVPGAVPLSFSVGFSYYHPATDGGEAGIEELMIEADKQMYIEKQSSRASRTFQEKAAALSS